jgi:5S rRNA maturation endonuclease (ribonuclease M5)
MTYREGDIESVLVRLNIDYSSRGYELSGVCPGHLKTTGREDRNPSWSINSETGAHHCFSCGYRGSLLSLVCDLLGFENYRDAERWLKANVEIDLDSVVKQTQDLQRESYRYLPKPVPMSEARLAVFTDPPQWALEARQVTREACLKHKVKWVEGMDNWILPIREPEAGKLLGWQEKGQGHKHFLNRPTGMKKAATLFGIEQFLDLDINDMIVVESPLDVVRLSSMGIRGGVATMGASVSVEQVKLMRRAERVTIAMDNPSLDAAGAKAVKELTKLLPKYGVEFQYFNYGDSNAKDIGDMTDDEVWFGLEKAKHMALGKLAYL